MRKIIVGFIRLYQVIISPLLGPRCRFYPACSHYAVEAVQVHGATKGSWMSFKRIVRCHPLNPGGVDLVPQADPNTQITIKNNTLVKGEQTHG